MIYYLGNLILIDMIYIVKCWSGSRTAIPVILFVNFVPLVSVIRKDRGLLQQPDNANGIFILKGKVTKKLWVTRRVESPTHKERRGS